MSRLVEHTNSVLRRAMALLVMVAMLCMFDAGRFDAAAAVPAYASGETCWAKSAAAPHETLVELSSFDAASHTRAPKADYPSSAKAMQCPGHCAIDYAVPAEALTPPLAEQIAYSEMHVHVWQGLVPAAQPKPPR